MTSVVDNRFGSIGNLSAQIESDFVAELGHLAGAKHILGALKVAPSTKTVFSAAQYLERLRFTMRIAEELKSGARDDIRRRAATGRDAFRQPRRATEYVVSSKRLDIEGRIDLLERLSANSVRITEFKSGRSFVYPGHVSRATQLQLASYGALWKDQSPTDSIMLRVLARDGEWVCAFTEPLSEEIESLLEELSIRLPRGREVEPAELARPGDACALCVHRMSCDSYRHWATTQWSSNVAQLPYDTWGRIQSIDVITDSLANISVRDAAARYVRVVNVPLTLIGNAKPGNAIEAANLRSSETGRGKAYPFNFYVADRHRTFRSAFSVAINISDVESATPDV
jgi:hypothetical protein